MITQEKVWVRIAANGPGVKEGRRHTWRCSIRNTWEGEYSKEIPLADCSLVGTVTTRNVIFGTDPKGSPGIEGAVAWIDLYGDAAINADDVLRIILRDP